MLTVLKEIDDRAIVRIIPYREENIMAVAVALDHDLVGTAPHDRAPAPAIALVDHIAQAGGELAHINVPLEGLQLPIFIHQGLPISFSLLPVAFCRLRRFRLAAT